MTAEELIKRSTLLEAIVEQHLSTWIAQLHSAKPGEIIMLHQDAFAADYQFGEYFLLGAAIKYAGLYDVEIRIHGRNRETLP